MPIPGSETFSFILKGAAAKAFTDASLGELCKRLKERAGIELSRRKIQSQTELLAKHIRQLRLVKTILQPEKAVDIITFYQPSRLEIADDRPVITCLSDIGHSGTIVIQGIAGQGKSIFLRYLAAAEYFLRKRVPIFLELRKIPSNESIHHAVYRELEVLGFSDSRRAFQVLAEDGSMVLLLDAFDELKDELKQACVSEVEDLTRQFPNLRIVVSSRPGSEITSSPLIRVFKLSSLQGDEYEQIIRKITHSPETASTIIKGIRGEGRTLPYLLTTPLMVALLVVRYRIDQSIPQNRAAFYDSLFTLLLQRHDKMKGGYVRPRKSRLSDTELLEIFNALCFVARKANETSFTQQRLAELASQALQLTNRPGPIAAILADIISITCLIVSDGDECRFIHKTIPEYHAALFIKSRPEEFAQKFYGAMPTKWRAWESEIAFLSTIDKYRFLRYFYIPNLRSILNTPAGDPPPPTDERVLALVGDDTLSFPSSKDEKLNCSMGAKSTGPHWPTDRGDASNLYFVSLFSLMKRNAGLYPDNPEGVPIREMFTNSIIGDAVKKICHHFYTSLLKELKDAEAFVSHHLSSSESLEF